MVAGPPVSSHTRRGSRALPVVLSLLVPGAGHALIGHIRRGFAWAAGLVAFGFIFVVAMPASLVALMVLLLLSLGTRVACAIDTVRLAGSRPSWKVLAGVWAILFVGGWILGDVLASYTRSHRVQAFTIPSRSMEPTLLWGDYVIADTSAQGGKSPRRGDVVVFKYPLDPRRTFLGRIVGMPGDTIQVRGARAFVNGRVLEEPYIKPGLGASPEWCKYAYGCEPMEVPAARYFVMGDNRDNAQDSRYYGFVRHEALIGRIFAIYWSWDSEAHWLRAGRVGRSL